MWQCMETNNLYPRHYECEGKAFLHWILTAYETWACSHERELKKESSEWHHRTWPQKCQKEQGMLLVMFSGTYNHEGVPLHKLSLLALQ